MNLFYRFIAGGIYLAPSLAFYSDERGWFRIIFSRPIDEIKLGKKICPHPNIKTRQQNKTLENKVESRCKYFILGVFSSNT